MIHRYQAELHDDPALGQRILNTLPPVPPEPEPVIVRVRREDVDRGIARAIALTIAGLLATVELIEEER